MRRLSKMDVGITVPLHLQQPLFIETDITYNLDMSKFPGLDDPRQMYEPALLIASNSRVCPDERGTVPAPNDFRCDSQSQRNGYMTHDHGRYEAMNNSQTTLIDFSTEMMPHTSEVSSKILEDVLSVIDSCPEGLLDKLVDTNVSSTSSFDYTASRIPHCAYLANEPCRPPMYPDNAQPLYSHNVTDCSRDWTYNTRVFPSRDAGLTHIPDYVRNLSALSCVKTNACVKRKRRSDEDGSNYGKRRYKALQSVGVMYHHGYNVPYTGQYQPFCETMFGRGVMT